MNKHALFASLVAALIFSPYNAQANVQSADISSNETMVIPSGKSIGVTLSTDGVFVVNVSSIQTSQGTVESPAKNAGIKAGDSIIEFNETPISDVDDLTAAVNSSNGKTSSVVISRDSKTIEAQLTPLQSSDDSSFKIGAWVKDAASGIGTMTYYNPSDNTFAALGHGICDPETGNIIALDDGKILNSTVVSVEKGIRGAPGELKGVFTENEAVLGSINKNTPQGLFGTIENSSLFSDNKPLPLADKNEVVVGNAYILTNIEGNNIEQFNVEIVKVMPRNTSLSKGMIIKITDKKLIEKTGGIVQGMSGSPVVQNGKLVGAVTHVFVNDPTRGYGIFIENMLAEAEKISR